MTAHVHPPLPGGAAGDAASTAPHDPQDLELGEFSLVRGGPFLRILQRLGVVREGLLDASRQSLVITALCWCPFIVLALLERVIVGRWDPLIYDLSVHVRPLVGVPLLFLGDAALDVVTGHAVEQFAHGGFAKDPSALKRLVTQTRRLRDAVTPEVVMVAVAVLGSQILFWEGAPSTGLFRSRQGALTGSPASIWYAFVGLPMVQFLFLRWVWHWLIWSKLVWQLAHLHGDLKPLHPDRRGGIAFLTDPAIAFSGGIAALAAVQAGAWCSRIVFDGATARDFIPDFWVLLSVALLFTHGPLLGWTRRLWQIRHEGGKRFGELSVAYAWLFDRKWLEGVPWNKPLLGASDIQSLADLSTSFTIVDEIRLVPFNRRSVFIVAIAVALPMLPVLLTQVPLLELLHRLASVAIGHLGAER